MGHNIIILKNCSQKWITNLKKTMAIEFDLFITVQICTNLATFWPNVHFVTLQGLLNFQILEKWWKIKFFTLKIYIVLSFELSIVAWSQHIALKLLWRIWESDVKEDPCFAPSSKYFTKHLKFKCQAIIFLIWYQFSKILTKDLPRYKESFISI